MKPCGRRPWVKIMTITIYGIQYLWNPPRIFLDFPEPQIMDSQPSFHQSWIISTLFLYVWPQKGGFPTPQTKILHMRAKAPKSSPDLPLHQSEPVRQNPAPIPPLHQTWSNVLSQPGPNRIIYVIIDRECIYTYTVSLLNQHTHIYIYIYIQLYIYRYIGKMPGPCPEPHPRQATHHHHHHHHHQTLIEDLP